MPGSLIVRQTIARNLRYLLAERRRRRQRPGNMHQLCLASGVAYPAVRRHCRGMGAPSAVSMIRYCRAFGVSVAEIVEGPQRMAL